ncbi:MAG: restriction endonuclease subunit S, partial [Lactobacillus sp.]|nr:restriction endonuclease subunit S [Lactobacillus sp.]
PGVDRNVLHQLKVPFIPSVSCQKEIVHILELLDKKIENNMQINDNLAA